MGRPEQPTDEEREWLLARLAELVADGGFERLVSAPLVQVSDEWFPERWSPTAGGVQVLLRRLLFHAGMADIEVVVDDLREVSTDGRQLQASAIRYAGHSDNRVWFELWRLGNDDLVGILCHEVGMAYVDVRGLARAPGGVYREHAEDPDASAALRAARLGSVAAVYLGLGVPAANASHNYRAAGHIEGNHVVTEWMVTTAGALPAQALAYLLAVQQVIRGRDAPAYRALLTNQRTDLESWREELSDERDQLVRALGLPPESEWPAPSSPPVLEPFEYDDPPEPEAPDREFNRGLRVYRVRETRVVLGSCLGSAIGLAIGWPTISVAHGFVAFVAATAATAVGAILGRQQRRDLCSDQDCKEVLPADAVTCPRCAGTIAGEIDHADDRLEREEEAGE